MPKTVDLVTPPEAPRPIPPGSNLPALPREPRAHGWVGWAALAVVLVAVLAGGVLARERIVEVWPPATRLYAFVGLVEPKPIELFELRDVKQSTFVEDERTVVVVSGKIVNISMRSQPVPKVFAQMFDTRQRVLDEWYIDAVRPELGPGEITEFSDRVIDPPKGAANLMVRLTNGG
ncbi:MAG: DUF3426 domain-containing protein [Alphaproteobacteria bacterium]